MTILPNQQINQVNQLNRLIYYISNYLKFVFSNIITTSSKTKTTSDFVEVESITQKDIDEVDAEIIEDLEGIYDDNEYDVDEMEDLNHD